MRTSKSFSSQERSNTAPPSSSELSDHDPFESHQNEFHDEGSHGSPVRCNFRATSFGIKPETPFTHNLNRNMSIQSPSFDGRSAQVHDRITHFPHSVRHSSRYVHQFGEAGWTPSVLNHPLPHHGGSSHLLQYLDLSTQVSQSVMAHQMSSPMNDDLEPPGFPPLSSHDKDAAGMVGTPAHIDVGGFGGWGHPPSGFPEWSDGFGPPWPVSMKSNGGVTPHFFTMPSPSCHMTPHMGSITPFPGMTHGKRTNLFAEEAPLEEAPGTPSSPPLDLWRSAENLPSIRPLTLDLDSPTAASEPVTSHHSNFAVKDLIRDTIPRVTGDDWENEPSPKASSQSGFDAFEGISPSGVPRTVAQTSRAAGTSVQSIGSSQHPTDCRPCAFFWTKGCINGNDCRFCHEWHPPKKKKPMKEQKNLMIIARPDGKIEFMRCTVSEALRVL